MKKPPAALCRPVAETDLDELSSIVSLSDAEIAPLMRDDVNRWLTAPRSPESFQAVECDGRVVGMGGYVPDAWGSTDVAWLVWFYFDPAYQRCGLGRMLYQRIEAELAGAGIRKLYLDVGNEADHTAAIAFHHSNGYRREGTLTDYWKDGEDFLIFGKRLTGC